MQNIDIDEAEEDEFADLRYLEGESQEFPIENIISKFKLNYLDTMGFNQVDDIKNCQGKYDTTFEKLMKEPFNKSQYEADFEARSAKT